MSYTIALESFDASYEELEPLYRKHYAEMQARLSLEGVPTADYNPRLDEYSKASVGGWLLTFVLRCEGKAVGYSNIYITNDMHNGERIAQEDTIYVLQEHRRFAGRMLIKAVHAELRVRQVKRFNVSTMTDLRVSKLLQRMGYKHTAHNMTLNFGEPHVLIRPNTAASA